MEGERRKRKLENEEENEEQKMEKFFALIKSTKHVRDLLSKEKIEKVDDEKAKDIWTPMFQPEDFVNYGEFGRRSNIPTPHVDAGPSEKEKEVIIEKENLEGATIAAAAPATETEDKEKASDHLDLNLSL